MRNGLNFTERGYGVRGALGVSDRGHSAASQARTGRVRLGPPIRRDGVRWLHTGGIFAALSETTPEVIEEALVAARAHGTVVSYDLNYRPSLWKSTGGPQRAREINRRLARHVDVMIGNEEDFTACLGLEVDGIDIILGELDTASFRSMIDHASTEFPNLKVIATTLRAVRTATLNDWGAIAWSRETGFVQATPRPGLEILDRVGGGDSFAAGLIYGLMEHGDLQQATEYGAAHGALAMTTPGDTSTATLAEVQALVTAAVRASNAEASDVCVRGKVRAAAKGSRRTGRPRLDATTTTPWTHIADVSVQEKPKRPDDARVRRRDAAGGAGLARVAWTHRLRSPNRSTRGNGHSS